MIADPNDAKRFTDEQTDKRIHELLINENDSVSEKDISNIKTDVVEDTEPGTGDGENLKGDTNPGIDTVWNIEEGEK